jgi:DNA helicase IV
MMIVGDDWQAIYAFAGADSNSIATMIQHLQARPNSTVQVLPLTKTWRCGRKIVERVNRLVPGLQAHESNPEGVVELNVPVDRALAQIKPGVMILCRVNSPLVRLFFRLFKLRIKAFVRGRNIGENLWTIISKEIQSVLPEDIEAWRAKQEERLNRVGSRDVSEQLILLADRVECIKILADGCTNIGEVKTKIDEIFVDDMQGGVCLSSVHRAKGLEADTVMIAEPQKMPHPMAKTPEAQRQEKHLQYVAETRAKNRLIILQPMDTGDKLDEFNEGRDQGGEDVGEYTRSFLDE